MCLQRKAREVVEVDVAYAHVELHARHACLRRQPVGSWQHERVVEHASAIERVGKLERLEEGLVHAQKQLHAQGHLGETQHHLNDLIEVIIIAQQPAGHRRHVQPQPQPQPHVLPRERHVERMGRAGVGLEQRELTHVVEPLERRAQRCDADVHQGEVDQRDRPIAAREGQVAAREVAAARGELHKPGDAKRPRSADDVVEHVVNRPERRRVWPGHELRGRRWQRRLRERRGPWKVVVDHVVKLLERARECWSEALERLFERGGHLGLDHALQRSVDRAFEVLKSPVKLQVDDELGQIDLADLDGRRSGKPSRVDEREAKFQRQAEVHR